MKILDEFKKFAIKGNVVDMGVGIIIGGAFGTIVSSFVKDIIMPPIGLITGGVDFSNKVWILKKETEVAEAITLNYGAFVNNILTFVIVAFVLFLIIKQMNNLKEIMGNDEKEKVKKTKPKAEEVVLLSEIRDILKKN